MFASTLQDGQCLGSPDVCKKPTPNGPIPLPFPNKADCPTAQSSSCSAKVLISNQKTFNLKTKIPQSQGDQDGSLGGVVSNKMMGEVSYIQGSTSVYIQGAPAVFQNSLTLHNGAPPNINGSQVKPSQTKVNIGR